MKKWIQAVLLVVACLWIVPAVQVHAAKPNITTANTTILLNGTEVMVSSYNIDGYNYFQLRELAQILAGESAQFDISWDEKNKVIELIPKQRYVYDYASYYRWKYDPDSVVKQNTKLKVNNKIQTVSAYNIDGSTYFQLRELSKLLNFTVGYKAATGTLTMDTAPVKGKTTVERFKAESYFEGNYKTGNHSRWASRKNEFIFENPNGTISTLSVGDEIVVKTYDASYKIMSTKKIAKELSFVGTFYSGKNYNYIAFGKENLEEANKEVIRIVKYDKQFNRIAATPIYGHDAYTTVPFDASSGGQMVEVGDELIYHTSRERYLTEDGLNHQSNLTIQIDIPTMKQLESIGAFQRTHVSHSFDQYVVADEHAVAFLDHGDAYPRSIALRKELLPTNDENQEEDDYFNDAYELDVFPISGAVGANVTGVSIGGFEVSNSHYLVAFNSINQNNSYTYDSYYLNGGDENKRNVYVYAVNKDFSYDVPETMTKTLIASYWDTPYYTSTPTLVKMTNDRLVVLWQEFSQNFGMGNLKYVILNGRGERVSDTKVVPTHVLSDVQPIVKGNKMIWYTKEKNQTIMYEIEI